MNFLKPTKSKISGTIIIYLAKILAGWVKNGLTLILSRKYLQAAAPYIAELVQKASLASNISLVAIIQISGFFIEIIFIYLAVCLLISNLPKKREIIKS